MAHTTNAKPGSWTQNATSSRAVRALMHEYQSLQKEPMEGFRVRLLQESDLFHWEVAIFGPPSTPYQGGYFKANMKFPHDYPFSPPSLRFTTKMWHPNVYENGDLCISILHPPSNDPYSDELACERWNPTQNVRTILMSVISLLNEPNISSPANVDASVMWRRFKEQNDGEYERVVKNIVLHTLKDAEKDKVVVPTSVEDYCKSSSSAALSNLSSSSSSGALGNNSAVTASSSSRSTSNAHFDSLLEPDEFFDDEDFYDEETDEEDEDEDAARTIVGSSGGAAGTNAGGPTARDDADDDTEEEEEQDDDDAVECDKREHEHSCSSSNRVRSRKGSNGLVVASSDTKKDDNVSSTDAVSARRQCDADAVSVADDEGHVDEAGDVICSITDGDDALRLRASKSIKDKTSGAHRVIVSDALTGADDESSSAVGKRRGSAEKVETRAQQQTSSKSSVANE